MLSNLSQRILEYIRARPEGVKIVTLEVMVLRDDGGRYPPQEIEAAVSQLKRANFITQRRPGEWMPATAGPIHVEREPDHARIRELDVVDRRPELDANFPAVTEARAFAESTRTAQPPTQERTTMAKAKKTCTKCEKAKAPQAFKGDSEVCRFCTNAPAKASKPKRAAKPKAAAPRKKLRQIVARHTRRGDEDPTLGALRARRERLAQQLAAVDQAIEVLEEAA